MTLPYLKCRICRWTVSKEIVNGDLCQETLRPSSSKSLEGKKKIKRKQTSKHDCWICVEPGAKKQDVTERVLPSSPPTALCITYLHGDVHITLYHNLYLLVLPHLPLDGGFQRQIFCLDSLLYVCKFNLIYLYQCVPGTQQILKRVT